ncbi:MAG: WG repeat-containing protein [Bacteroidia bacterium]
MPKSSRFVDILIITLFVSISIVVVLFATGVIHLHTSSGPPIKYGYLNTKGEIAIDIQYDSVCDFHHGLATVYRNGKAEVIDASGKTVNAPPSRYLIDSLPIAHRMYSAGEKDDPALKRDCAPVTSPSFGKTLYRVLGGTGTLTDSGPRHFYSCFYFFLPAGKKEKPHLYETALPYHDSLAAVHAEVGKVWNRRWFDKSWGFIDVHGEYRAKPFYCTVHSYSEGLAAVAIKMVPHNR